MKQNKQKIDWDNLGFNPLPTRSMWKGECVSGDDWINGKLIPYGEISLSPAACVLNYGQGIFEGMKAYHTAKDRIVLFRPDKNSARMEKSTERMCIPKMNEKYFMNAVSATVKDNADFIPPFGKGSMYIRPICFGVSKAIAVQAATEYVFMVFTSPVGPYFKVGAKPLHLYLTDKYHRAAPKGIGNAKAIGNYSASLYPGSEAKSKGFNDMIYVHAKNEKIIEEMGAANLFVLCGDELLTPKLGGSILDGVTRDSVITIARDLLNLTVRETDVEINTMLSADEVFCCGTAVTVTGVGRISTDKKEHVIGDGNFGEKTLQIKKKLLQIQKEEIDDPFGWIHPLS
tara:strand:- start:4019 stop:5047 length:1029 start_codon:yes stop_codon:yes gene_type:complete